MTSPGGGHAAQPSAPPAPLPPPHSPGRAARLHAEGGPAAGPGPHRLPPLGQGPTHRDCRVVVSILESLGPTAAPHKYLGSLQKEWLETMTLNQSTMDGNKKTKSLIR